MFPGPVIYSYPSQDHDPFSDSTQVCEDGRASVCLFDVGHSNERLIDGLEDLSIDTNVGSINIWLASLGGEKQKFALRLEPLQNL